MLLVSMDGHVAPALADYRPYCERRLLDEFDAFVGAVDADFTQLVGASQDTSERKERYFKAIEEGYGDPALALDVGTRIASLDADGIVAETLFHGTFNGDPIPFFSPGLTSGMNQDVPATAIAPERLIGIAHLPAWDLDAAIAEVKWAKDAGLRGINFPSPRVELPSFNKPVWYPFWQACVDTGMSLHTHSAVASTAVHDGPGSYGIFMSESHFTTRRAMPQMIFGGVFERFPDLQLVLVEQSGGWLSDTLHNLDSAYLFPQQDREIPFIRDVLPRRPSDYFRTNVYMGDSFMSRAEAVEAIDHDLWRNSMWGRDFPHPEGTWPFTSESLRKTFGGLPEDKVRAITGENALRVMRLDATKLRRLAQEIGPTFDEITRPFVGKPDGAGLSLGFREVGAFY
jgi:predicted TIM-barrel fold metal-dependent hydrolase